MPDYASQETIVVKDVVSYTDDNTTLISDMQKSTAASPLTIHKTTRVICQDNNLKHNLFNAYDVDGNASMSSTKLRTIGMEDGMGKGIGKLLIPKLEK
ncbi:hypothetical protein L1887_22122 [Cichorium endivia]|nr:hypothetical protein L1887_22122 [Cichorium endivia]